MKKPGRKRIEDKQPYVRAEIVRAYAETGSLKQTAAALGISDHTVLAVFERNPEDFAMANNLGARGYAIDADACRKLSMEPERLACCSAPQLAVMSGIYADKSLAFQQRLNPSSMNIEELRSFAKSLADTRRELESKTINVAQEKPHEDEKHEAQGNGDGPSQAQVSPDAQGGPQHGDNGTLPVRQETDGA